MSPLRPVLFLSAIAANLWAQEPSSRLEVLLEALDDDSIEVRERAGIELEKLSEAARPALVRELGKTSSPEVRGRIGDILGRLDREKRRKGFKGGKSVGGFSAALKVKSDLRYGTISFEVEIMNVGTESRDLVLIQCWDTWLPKRLNESTDSHAQLRVVRMGPGWEQTNGGGKSHCGSPARILVFLEPGESRTFKFQLDWVREGYYTLFPGDYEARVTYYAKEKELLPGAAEDLETDWVRFTVKE